MFTLALICLDRLIIISVSAQRASKTSGPSVDLSMWIALNNIMSVDLGSEAYVSSFYSFTITSAVCMFSYLLEYCLCFSVGRV